MQPYMKPKFYLFSAILTLNHYDPDRDRDPDHDRDHDPDPDPDHDQSSFNTI